MQKKSYFKPLMGVIILAAIVGLYFLITGFTDKKGASLEASGTIEAISSSISPESSGKVSEIYVEEGDAIKKGDALFRMDDALLQAQKEVAQNALELARSSAATADAVVFTAQTSYEAALASSLLESAVVRQKDWDTSDPKGFTLPGGSFTQVEWIEAAQKEIETAIANRDEIYAELESLLSDPNNDDFIQLENALLAARFAAESAGKVYDKAGDADNSDLRDAAKTAWDDAVEELENLQSEYDDFVEDGSGEKIIDTRIDLVMAEERIQAAREKMISLQTGEYSLKVQTAQASLNQAQAAADQAQQAVEQAQANLDLIDVQITKLIIRAPEDGVVLTRSIEVGEVISAGTKALEIGELSTLSITVFVPEAEIGLLEVGQTASLKVDSFPDTLYSAVIVDIADEAEYTPRNVQTVEGRKSTVFAVKLQAENPDGELKPGMPADITFDVEITK